MAVYGKVLKVFDESTLLVNLGRKEGVRRGNTIVVIEKGGDVKDPDTGESLGELELIKAELVVLDVQERMSVAGFRLVEETGPDMPLSSKMVRDSVKVGRERGRTVGMDVRPGEVSGRPAVSPVKKGDIARLIE